MDVDSLLAPLIEGRNVTALLAAPLPDDLAAQIVERLKQEADRQWRIDPNCSLVLADYIMTIGEKRGDLRQVALGTMARGDALRVLGQLENAWETLEHAGRLFQQARDEVGWARTRIGRLFISPNLNHVPEAMADAECAREIFVRHSEEEKLLRLELNVAAVYNWLGSYREALNRYRSAAALAESMGTAGQDYQAWAYLNMGYAENGLGNFRQALHYYRRAYDIRMERGETGSAGVAMNNIAYIAFAQGDYRRALDLLHRFLKDGYENRPLEGAIAKRDMVECYLALNRYADARELAHQVVNEFYCLGATYHVACTLVHAATAEAEASNYETARAALDSAEPIFLSLDAMAWVMMVRLRRGQIAWRQGDFETASREASATASYFSANSEQINSATAILLQGKVALAVGDLDTAAKAGSAVVRIARRCNVPALLYAAHLLMGHVMRAQGRSMRSVGQYGAAAQIVERVQRGLTITLRPGFLEDKSEALRALVSLHLENDRIDCAFETLERTKSQILLSHIASGHSLRWSHDDTYSQALIEDLNRLREEHHWYYRLAHGQDLDDKNQPRTVSTQDALKEVAERERRMRAITEQLYLHGNEEQTIGAIQVPDAETIRASLPDDALLIEYYNDGHHLWAFTLDQQTLKVYPLALTVDSLNQLLSQFQFNVACALKVDPCSSIGFSLAGMFRRIAQQLYTALIKPFESALQGRKRLVVVPYGALHYLPFHLLHTGSAYLLERHEVVVLPAAGLATRRSPKRPAGALVLAHSWEGKLPQTNVEAKAVHHLLGGEVFYEQSANRVALQAQPRQVLHIAAHGQHRIDQPDLSYIELADGQLYTDDLFQNDLSYELVTLTVCETGRANVVGGDELIGLGRGFLYMGAGAIIASLWRVDDSLAVLLMAQFYYALRAGATKAAALRDAQRAVLAVEPQLHPAFWGAFQLVGNADPLSTTRGRFDHKEQDHGVIFG